MGSRPTGSMGGMLVPWSGVAVETLGMPVDTRTRDEIFDEIYRTYAGYVWKSARRLGVSREAADDVLQETFLNVHRLLGTYEPRGSMQSWLFSVLLRVVQRHRRSHERRPKQAASEINIEALPGAEA